MKAVWLRVRSDLRARRVALLGLALLIGLAAGAVQAAAIGARRTESAYPRFVRAQRALDFVVSQSEGQPRSVMEAIARVPEVADSTFVFAIPAEVTGPNGRSRAFPDVLPLVDRAGKFGVTLNVAKVLQGRLPDPNRPEEAALSFGLAEALDVQPGTTVNLAVYGEDAHGNTTSEPIANIPLRIVGIVAAPGEFQGITGASIPALQLAPAWAVAHPELVPPREESLAVRLRDGATGDEFFRALRARALDFEVDFTQSEQMKAQQRSNRYQAIALWILAAMAGLAAIGIFGPTLARQSFLDAIDYPILSALGMTSGQLVAIGIVRTAAVAGVAMPIAAITAYLLTPLTPLGLARIAEPNPGLWLDGMVLTVGAVIVFLVVLVVALPGIWRTARLASARSGGQEQHAVSRLATALAASGLPPSVVTGIRMALEPGRGRTAVPVRAAILGTTFGIAALLGAVTFSGSLQVLLRQPELSGWNWDAIIGPQGQGAEADIAAAAARLDSDPAVKEYTLGTATGLRVGTEDVFAIVMDPGPVTPSLIEGAPPTGSREIAIGSQTLRAIHAEIGDIVDVAIPSELGTGNASGTLGFKIVGRVAVPSFFFSNNEPGEGAVLTIAGIRSLTPTIKGDSFFVRFSPGARPAGERSLRQAGFFILPRRQTDDVTNLRRLAGTPVVLAGLLAALSAGTLVHTLLTTTRRRRRDLAILKTLGFRRRQLIATVVWQASTLAIVSVVIGVPIGVALGRLAWRLFADQIGVLPAAAMPWLGIALVGPAAIALACAISFLPGRAAARVRAADVLRTE